MGNNANNENTVLFKELSYQIVGASFAVYNEIGFGLSEKIYQNALAREFEKRGVQFEMEAYLPFVYKDENLVRYFADFLIEKSIVVELKVVKKLTYSHARQLLTYLRNSGIKLGILIYFTSEGVKYRRVLNSQVGQNSHY
jgi:GxxExxY protein